MCVCVCGYVCVVTIMATTKWRFLQFDLVVVCLVWLRLCTYISVVVVVVVVSIASVIVNACAIQLRTLITYNNRFRTLCSCLCFFFQYLYFIFIDIYFIFFFMGELGNQFDYIRFLKCLSYTKQNVQNIFVSVNHHCKEREREMNEMNRKSRQKRRQRDGET